jgi:hypothetical protein
MDDGIHIFDGFDQYFPILDVTLYELSTPVQVFG